MFAEMQVISNHIHLCKAEICLGLTFGVDEVLTHRYRTCPIYGDARRKGHTGKESSCPRVQSEKQLAHQATTFSTSLTP
jgi:hypothetical protein